MNETIEYYNRNAETFIAGTLHADMSENRNRFLRYVKPGGRILDAGCGSGRDSLAFMKSGYQVDAFDASEEICRLASKTLGFPVECKRFEELTGTSLYDGIWACASLLHVSGEELPGVMCQMKKLLKPEGVLYASFKKGNTERKKDGRFFHDMTENACRDLFQNIDMEVLDVFLSQDVREGRADEYWVNIIGKKGSLKKIHVVAAVIYDEEKIFATQRGYGDWKDYWEFPGGKIEPGETPEEAVCREIREELDTEIKVGEKISTIEYDYPEFHLSMDCYLAEVKTGELVLKEHEAARWLNKDELDSVNWLPADRKLIDVLKETCGSK